MDSKKHKLEIVILAVTLVTVAFIWVHSMMSGEDSSKESGWVMELVRPFLEIFMGEGQVTHHFVRKLAHFTEYFVFGAELTIYLRLRLGRCGLGKALLAVAGTLGPMLAGLIVAAIDESIQILADSRGPSVSDALLDFSGAASGTIVTMAVMLIVLALTQRKRGDEDPKRDHREIK